MNKPKMVLFDYGQTLVNEAKFDGVKGTEAVLKYAMKNKYGYSAQEIQAVADAMNQEMGRFDPARRHSKECQIEVPNHEFEFIIATSEYMYRKPNRRIFELALEKADLKPEEVWYVGDNYACDVEGARGAGLFSVWYVGATESPGEPKEETLVVESWEKLKRFLD